MRRSNCVIIRFSACSTELFGKFLESHEILKPLLHREAEILPNQSTVDVTLISFNHAILRALLASFCFHPDTYYKPYPEGARVAPDEKACRSHTTGDVYYPQECNG